MLRPITALLLLAATSAGEALAQAPAAQPSVEAMQSPAWVERAGRREPLEVGMRLRNGDRVLSGAAGRVVLRMPEGSVVKLGAQAQLALDRLSLQRDSQGSIARAALDVLRGAFRFTTQAAARYRGRREIDVRIATVTAGIRGTDLWGKAADDRDIVCLIEGRVSVQRGSEPAFAMDEPLSFYIAPRNAPPLAVRPVPAEQLRQWAAETDIAPGGGSARRDGRWTLELAVAASQDEALALYDRLRLQGYPARIVPLKRAEGYAYAVRIVRLASATDADALAARLRDVPGVREPRALPG